MIELLPLETLDADATALVAAETATAVNEYDDRVDVTRGALFSVLCHLHALLTVQRDQQLQALFHSRSLEDLRQNPELASDELVDAIVANFGVARQSAVPAQGEVVIVRDTDTPLVVPAGSVFSSGTVAFSTREVFAAHSDPGDVATSSDRLISQIGTGQYAFTLTVVCDTAGTVGMLRQGAALTPATLPVGFLRAYAASDFRDGRNLEDNESLLRQLEAGVARPSLASRPEMRALLQRQTDLADWVADSVVGAGEPELRRDRHTILPISLGGRFDWYVRTDPLVTRRRLTKTATLVAKTASDLGSRGQWQFTLLPADAPGFYDVVDIKPAALAASAGGCEQLSDTRGFDLAGAVKAPDVVTAAEAVYSPYQTAVIVFQDDLTDTTDLAVGDTASYVCDVRYLTRLDQIQALVENPQLAHNGADCLVRAPVPCFVSLQVALTRRTTDPAFDLEAIRAALVRVVNSTPFEGRLYASLLYDAVHNLIGGNGRVVQLVMSGRVRAPDGSYHYLDGQDVLLVPELPLEGLSHKTVQFFCDTDQVDLQQTTDVPTPR